MPQVLAWKSPDNRLFEDVVKYRKHLKKLAANRMISRKNTQAKQEVSNLVNTVFRTVKTVEELLQVIRDNWKILHWAALDICSNYKTAHIAKCLLSKKPWIPKLVRVNASRVQFSKTVSNAHCCPAGGVTNWHRHEMFADGTPKPVGYPGARLDLEIEIEGMWSVYLSDLVRRTTLRTNSGGSCDSKCNYSITLFAQEFPEMWNTHNRAELYKKLSHV